VVEDFLVSWFTVYFFVDGDDQSGAGVMGITITGFPPVFHVGVSYFEVYVVRRWISVTCLQVLGGADDNGARGMCRCEVS
jgi:hypothetical protein